MVNLVRVTFFLVVTCDVYLSCTIGYSGSISATYFGFIVPGIPVQTVPIDVDHFGSISATLRDQ